MVRKNRFQSSISKQTFIFLFTHFGICKLNIIISCYWQHIKVSNFLIEEMFLSQWLSTSFHHTGELPDFVTGDVLKVTVRLETSAVSCEDVLGCAVTECLEDALQWSNTNLRANMTRTDAHVLLIYPHYSKTQTGLSRRTAGELWSLSGCVLLIIHPVSSVCCLWMSCCLTTLTISLCFTPTRPGETTGYTNHYIQNCS